MTMVMLVGRRCVDVVERKVAIVLVVEHWCKWKAAREERQSEEVSWCLEDKNRN
jgi:hypothetical protein